MHTSERAPWLFYAIFFATGIGTAQMGNALPRLHAADSAAGFLLAAQFTGQLFGALFVGKQPARAVFYGLGVASVTALLLARSTLPHAALLALYGLGLGISMTAVSIASGMEADKTQRNQRMQMLNVFWPLGAAAAPWFVDLVTHSGFHVLRSYSVLALMLMILASLFAFQQRGRKTSQLRDNEPEHHLRGPRFALICLFALLAVGIEASLANWMPTYAARYITAAAAGIATSAFWAGILSGRIVADRFLRRTSWKIFGTTCALLCALAAHLVSRSHTPIALAIASFVAAFFVSPLYPAILAHSVHVRWRNLVFVAGGCGSAFVPWLVGRVSSITDSLSMAFLVPVIAAILLALCMAIGIRGRETSPAR